MRWSREEARKMAQRLYGERIVGGLHMDLIEYCRCHANVPTLSEKQVTEIARLFNIHILSKSNIGAGARHESN